MKIKLFVAGLAMFLPTVANANVIKQRAFHYSFDVANTTQSDVFVVCANSLDDRISVLPALPPLAMRLSHKASRDEPINATAYPIAAVTDCRNCLLGTVHFPIDSAELSHKERAKLDELIRTISAGTVVNLDGYTCDLGTSAHNLGLSLRRARGVALFLKRRGISVGKVEGQGKCCPMSDDRHLNRRVEITTQQ